MKYQPVKFKKQNENEMKITTSKDKTTNKVSFYQNGESIYPVSVSGNQYEFENGQIVLI